MRAGQKFISARLGHINLRHPNEEKKNIKNKTKLTQLINWKYKIITKQTKKVLCGECEGVRWLAQKRTLDTFEDIDTHNAPYASVIS